jgi:hypothetical protein
MRGAEKEDRAAATSSDRTFKVRSNAHYGLKSEIALCPKGADFGSRPTPAKPRSIIAHVEASGTPEPMEEIAMTKIRLISALMILIAIVVTMVFTSVAVQADGNYSRPSNKNALIVAQSDSDRAACRLGCNGDGVCLQACDVTTCRQACGGDGTCLQACEPSTCRLNCNGDGACLQGCAERDRGLGNR